MNIAQFKTCIQCYIQERSHKQTYEHSICYWAIHIDSKQLFIQIRSARELTQKCKQWFCQGCGIIQDPLSLVPKFSLILLHIYKLIGLTNTSRGREQRIQVCIHYIHSLYQIKNNGKGYEKKRMNTFLKTLQSCQTGQKSFAKMQCESFLGFFFIVSITYGFGITKL